MVKVRLESETGMTIVEILVAIVIFMAGFSVLIALMNSTLLRFSTRKLLAADNLAHEVTVLTTSTADTTPIDSVIERSGLEFRVLRRVTLEGKLAEVTVSVIRNGQEKKIVELNDAFILANE